MTPRHNYQVTRGDTFTRSLIFVDATTGLPKDITGRVFYITVKQNITDADPGVAQSITSSHDNPTGGLSHVTLTHTQTQPLLGLYYFDIEEIMADGVTVRTLLTGTITFNADVTITV
jgi:hypothetical protein